MKKIVSVLLAALLVFSVVSVSVFAEEDSEISDETSVAVYVEPANKKFTWIYILVGIAAIGGVIGAAVAISKKTE